jgi:hypothetical protein
MAADFMEDFMAVAAGVDTVAEVAAGTIKK